MTRPDTTTTQWVKLWHCLVPTINLLGAVTVQWDRCGWALAATDGHGAIGRSTRPHLFFFWLIIGSIFHAVSGTTAGRWLRRMAVMDTSLVRVSLFLLSLFWSLCHAFSRCIRDDSTVLAESIQSNR
eukprot:scaffold137147_cov67-Attheya_sp.AAC.1